MAAPVIASDSAEETKLVRLVSDCRSEVSTRAISLAHALLSPERAHSVLREEAKTLIRIAFLRPGRRPRGASGSWPSTGTRTK